MHRLATALLALLVCLTLVGCMGSRDVAEEPDLAGLLGQADAAYAGLERGDDGLGEYNRAVGKLARATQSLEAEELRERLRKEGALIKVGEVGLPFTRFHVIEDADEAGAGDKLGTPVVVEYNTEGTPLYPPEGVLRAGTAIYRAEPGRTREFALEVEQDQARLAGREFELRTDYTKPAAMTAQRARRFGKTGFSSMIHPQRMERSPQVYLIDPYDPGKRIVLMIHGLQSTPVAFAELVGALHADPVIRREYQIWQFHYATGTPLLVNALMLREHLERTIREVDPDGGDFATRNIVALGHSMGGLMAHTLVSSSGEALWESLFTVPPDGLRGVPADLETLRQVMHFQRNPRVVRVVFMASPHRGSPLSGNVVGFIGRKLTRLPEEFAVGLNGLPIDNPEAMTPAGRAFYNGTPFSAIRTLSSRNPSLRALEKLPIEVPYHSIIGQLRRGPREKGSDGVVPYTSSHLEGAESELVVRGGHNVFKEEAATREILRILRLEVGGE